jgi:outer membrane protein insertion porin family
VTAGSVSIKGLYAITEQEFADMTGFSAGKEINETIVRDGIKRAFLKGIFEDIAVRVPDGENPVVEVSVRERDFIRRIYVDGDYQLSKKVIKALFMFREDLPMRYDLKGSAVEDLKKKIGEYGYPDSRIGLGVEKTSTPYRVDLRLSVDTGAPLLVGDIKFRIIPPYPAHLQELEGGLAGRMKTAKGDVYDQRRLAGDLIRLKEFLKKEGYYRPVVGPFSYRDGELEIVVNPGRHLSVTITGNEVISGKRLLKEITFSEIEDFNDELVEETADRMISLYHTEGYPFSRIAPVINADDQNIDVTFFVFEGERIRVDSVSFSNASLPHERLVSVMSLAAGEVYNPDLIEKDKDTLKEFYGALGYLDANVREMKVTIDRETQKAAITVDMEEGKKTELASVEIVAAGPELREKLLEVAGIKPGDPYNEVDISDARLRLLDYYTSSGYSNIDVLVERNIQDHKASVVFRVVEGEKIFIGKTVITGNEKTRYQVIKRELLHTEGQPYSFRVLAEERQRLYKLGLFTDVDLDAVDGGKNIKDILIKVEEGKAGAVEFGFGYGEFEEFRGFLEVSYGNLWGMNRRISARTEVSSLERRFILQYNEPWFLGRPLPFRAFYLHENKEALNISNKDVLYKLSRDTFNAGVEKKLSERVRAEFFYEFSVVRTTDVAPDVALSKEDTGTVVISGIKPALFYDTRDNPFDPKRGVLAGISVKIASAVLFSETDFAKMEVFGNHYHELGKRFTLALSVRGGVGRLFHSVDQEDGTGRTVALPLVERFFLGGRSTVRGYNQDTLGPKGVDGNPIGGNAFLMGSVELRTNVGRGIGLVPFLDMGNVWIKAGDINPGDLKYTTGLGLRYATPVGPLRVDYGIKLNREPGESQGEIHFSIGHAF